MCLYICEVLSAKVTVHSMIVELNSDSDFQGLSLCPTFEKVVTYTGMVCKNVEDVLLNLFVFFYTQKYCVLCEI